MKEPVRPEEKPKEDPRATDEMRAVNEADLESVSERNEHIRKENLRTIFSMGVRCLLVLIFTLVGITLTIVAVHYLGPKEWGWLEEKTLNIVTTSLFSGSISVFIGLYVRDRL